MINQENIPGFSEKDDFIKKYSSAYSKFSFRDRLTIFFASSAGFVAALAWDDALKSLFRTISSGGDTLSNKFIYAILVTLLALFISLFVRAVSRGKK